MKAVVIGGGAAGMSSASKLRRNDPDSEIVVIDSGSFVSYAECGIPYFLSGLVRSADSLIHYPLEEFTINRRIKVLTNTKVKSINTDRKLVYTSGGETLEYDKLIIASGSRAKRGKLWIDGKCHSVRTLDEAIQIKIDLKDKNVGILGDSILGVELASELSQTGWNVTLFSKHEEIMKRMDKRVIREMIEALKSKITVVYFKNLELTESERGNPIVKVNNSDLEFSHLFYAIGTEPNTEFLANSKIELDHDGFVLVNNKMETSVNGVYSAGDCAIFKNRIDGKRENFPLAQVANKMGRVAGANASGRDMIFQGSIGTTLLKVLDFEIGFCGLSEEDSKNRGFQVESKIVTGWSRAKYYPGGSNITVKIVYDKNSKLLLGGEICSKDNGAWRLNVIATAISGKMTTEDLFYADLGYTPPFGPVWDPIIIAASLTMRD